eukprot:s2670_g13.t1
MCCRGAHSSKGRASAKPCRADFMVVDLDIIGRGRWSHGASASVPPSLLGQCRLLCWVFGVRCRLRSHFTACAGTPTTRTQAQDQSVSSLRDAEGFTSVSDALQPP